MNLELLIIKGPCAGSKKIITKPQRILIGRDSSCDFAIQDPILSRQHCLVEITKSEIKLVDLKSRNGTFTNTGKIDEIRLKLNDEFKIGKHVLKVTISNSTKNLSNGVCDKCGKQISDVELRQMKAVKHGDKLFCESCLEGGIEASQEKRRKQTMPMKATKTNIPIRTMSRTLDDIPIVDKIEKKSIVKKIGPYEIIKVLGEGGMGFVYKAKHSFLETIVAIKVIKEALVSSPDILKRFLQEAKLGVTLEHPNIIKIHDAGESQGIYFIALEFFECKDLNDVVKNNGAISVEKVLKLSIQMASALDYAHKKGIIHRDVKPSNILINLENLVKVADFGLAKAWQKSGGSQLTGEGQMLGTLQYISPEQLEDSKNVDPRTDIFSLGATIYYALTGIPPFGEEPLGRVIQNILHEEPKDLMEIIPNIPKKLNKVIFKSLSKNIKQRYQTMEEFCKELSSIKIK